MDTFMRTYLPKSMGFNSHLQLDQVYHCFANFSHSDFYGNKAAVVRGYTNAKSSVWCPGWNALNPLKRRWNTWCKRSSHAVYAKSTEVHDDIFTINVHIFIILHSGHCILEAAIDFCFIHLLYLKVLPIWCVSISQHKTSLIYFIV